MILSKHNVIWKQTKWLTDTLFLEAEIFIQACRNAGLPSASGHTMQIKHESDSNIIDKGILC